MNILFVDDEEDLRELAEEIFTDEGFSLFTASDTNIALELFEQHQFDLVITDAHMPQGSGLDLCKTLREKHLFGGKLILVSGEIQRDGQKEQFGYDIAIDKPLNFTELIDLIRSL